jgi:hypothetical protein
MTFPLLPIRAITIAVLILKFSANAAFALDPHAEAVARIVEGAKGKVEKTEDGQSLKLVDLAGPNTGPHDKRANDPYDAAFFEHLGHVTTLESLNVISTKFNDEWMPSIAKLTNLKTLRFTNNGKLTDAGMEELAGLKNLEQFSFVGTQITGKAYAKFSGFTKLVKVSHRGSSIDDAGLMELCDHLPNLESISLAHAKFTDAGAIHFEKLTKLRGLEIGAHNATPKTLLHLAKLPLEYLQLGEGFESSECVALIKGIPTLTRVTFTNAKALTDADLQVLAAMPKLESLELSGVELTDERVEKLKAFAHLKALRILGRPKPYAPEVQAKIKALLPKTELKFE